MKSRMFDAARFLNRVLRGLAPFSFTLVFGANSAVVAGGELVQPISFLERVPTDGQASGYLGNASTSIVTNNIPLSGSAWTSFNSNDPSTNLDERKVNDESHVIHALIDHDVNGAAHRSVEMRLGEGGQIYSIKNANFGEAMPPQYRAFGSNKYAPWVDEVFQLIQLNVAEKNNASTDKYFLHQAGKYHYPFMDDKPFYSPILASGQIDDETFVMINWVQHAHLNETTEVNEHAAESIVYTKFRMVHGGVVEVTHLAYNYGSVPLDRFNIPWGGVRRTSLPEIMMSESTDPAPNDGKAPGTFYSSVPIWNTNTEILDDTDGWWIYAASKSQGATGLGLVVGKNFTDSLGDDHVRIGYTGVNPTGNETDWRNYLVTSVIRRPLIEQNDCLFARYYYVIGSVGNIRSIIESKNLVSHCTVDVRRMTAGPNEPLHVWRRTSAGAMPVLNGSGGIIVKTREIPLAGFKPVFVIRDTATSHIYVTYDPYKISSKPYDGKTEYIGFLGYANLGIYPTLD